MLWSDHQVGHAIEITLERGKEVRKVPLSEAAGSGVSASFALLASEEGYRKYDFRFDAGKSRWSLQEVRWIFPGVKLPGRNDVLILSDRAGARPGNEGRGGKCPRSALFHAFFQLQQ